MHLDSGIAQRRDSAFRDLEQSLTILLRVIALHALHTLTIDNCS